MTLETPQFIKGFFYLDDRGIVGFNNEFDFKDIKRFYIVENHRSHFIRAWHGHKVEKKYILCLSGNAMICAVKINDFKNPSKDLNVDKYFLSSRESSLLYIPAGYANGFMTLSMDTKIMIFSSSTIKESLEDDYRYDYNYWNPWEEKFR
jgi:dTDP-4-dehydrorhamnose 3,5-epimerase